MHFSDSCGVSGATSVSRVRNAIKSQKLNSPHTSKRQTDFSTFQSSYVQTRLILSRFFAVRNNEFSIQENVSMLHATVRTFHKTCLHRVWSGLVFDRSHFSRNVSNENEIYFQKKNTRSIISFILCFWPSVRWSCSSSMTKMNFVSECSIYWLV